MKLFHFIVNIIGTLISIWIAFDAWYYLYNLAGMPWTIQIGAPLFCAMIVPQNLVQTIHAYYNWKIEQITKTLQKLQK